MYCFAITTELRKLSLAAIEFERADAMVATNQPYIKVPASMVQTAIYLSPVVLGVMSPYLNIKINQINKLCNKSTILTLHRDIKIFTHSFGPIADMAILSLTQELL